VPRQPLAADTPLDVEQRQIDRWREMTPAEKAALISGLTEAAYEIAMAGIRHRNPGASPREVALRLAILTLGPDLARKVYPEIDGLDAP
jgi:hypothetical protein